MKLVKWGRLRELFKYVKIFPSIMLAFLLNEEIILQEGRRLPNKKSHKSWFGLFALPVAFLLPIMREKIRRRSRGNRFSLSLLNFVQQWIIYFNLLYNGNDRVDRVDRLHNVCFVNRNTLSALKVPLHWT